MNKNVIDRLAELVAGGAYVLIPGQEAPIAVGHGMWTEDGWAYLMPWPEDQHNAHRVRCDAGVVHYGRDVELTQDGVRVAYIAPADEWDLDMDEHNRVWGTWAPWIAEPDNLKEAEKWLAMVL